MVWSDCLHGFALDWVSPLTALNVTFIYLWSWDFGILFEKMLSAQIMWKILMGFTTEADARKPKPSGALPSAATKKAAALPLAAAIREGDIVYGKATKFKDRFDGVKCKVIAIQAQHYKVEILEGPAEGQKHRYRTSTHQSGRTMTMEPCQWRFQPGRLMTSMSLLRWSCLLVSNPWTVIKVHVYPL